MGSSEAEEQPIRRSLRNESRTPQGVVGGVSEDGGGSVDDRRSGGRDVARKEGGYGNGDSGDGSGEGGGSGGVNRDGNDRSVKLAEGGGPSTGNIRVGRLAGEATWQAVVLILKGGGDNAA